jgi:hypothetical protein
LIGKPGRLGAIPGRLSPVFRDCDELAASADIGQLFRTPRASAASVPPPGRLMPVPEIIGRFEKILSPWYSVMGVRYDMEQETLIAAYHLITRNRKAWPKANKAKASQGPG